jgi:uncharacterized membrane protein YdbT with pleckstrin-like domain
MLMARVKQTSAGKIKYFEDQFDDEEVLFVFRRHPIVMRKGLIFGMTAWLIGPIYVLILTYTKPNDPPSMALFGLSLVASIIVGSLIFMPWYISWYFSVFIVTDQRFIQITQKGMFKRSVVDMSLQQIQMINYEVAGLQETLLGFGTIMMQTFVGELMIHDVHHPAKIQKKLIGILREQGINTAPSASATLQNANTIDEQEA